MGGASSHSEGEYYDTKLSFAMKTKNHFKIAPKLVPKKIFGISNEYWGEFGQLRCKDCPVFFLANSQNTARNSPLIIPGPIILQT